MKSLCMELCEKSSLHGLQHLVSRHKTLWERVLWAVLLTVVTVLTVIRVYELWQATYKGSVVTVVENSQYDLSLVDFPAVTICPNIKAMEDKVRAAAKIRLQQAGDLSAFENTIITLSLMMYPFFNLPHEFLSSVNFTVHPVKGEDILDIMSEVGPELDDIMGHCKWRSVRYDCKDLFQKKLTQQGFCHSFNSKFEIPVNDSLETSLKTTEDVIRLRSNVFGRNSGLGFRLKSLGHRKLKSDVIGDSYSISVHNPANYPDFSNLITVLPYSPLKLTQISVSVATIEADNSLYNLDEAARDCVLANDPRPVSYCFYNCIDKILMEQCKCLPYFCFSAQRSEPICGVQREQVKCLSDINRRLQYHNNCHCRHLCSDTFYTAEKAELPVPPSSASDGRHWTRVRVIYKTLAVKYTRTSSYAFRDFLVGCGSYASLLLGFNAVAAFDFVVYLFKLFVIFVNCLLFYLFKQKVIAHNKSPCTSSCNNLKVSNRFKICGAKKNVVISKADELFIRTCDKKQLSAILKNSDCGHPIYPFLN